jgi:hypothetical protein
VSVSTAARPADDEFVPYYGKYIARVPESAAIPALERQLEGMLPLLRRLDDAQGALRYAPGKWSIKQVIGHLIDAERVFAYRALRFARADRTELPGFDENGFVEAAGFDRLPIRALVNELELVRRSSLAMFGALDEQAWLRRGLANGAGVSVRALAFIIAGHGHHHVALLNERYLPKPPAPGQAR